jgi:hypothetical protein
MGYYLMVSSCFWASQNRKAAGKKGRFVASRCVCLSRRLPSSPRSSAYLSSDVTAPPAAAAPNLQRSGKSSSISSRSIQNMTYIFIPIYSFCRRRLLQTPLSKFDGTIEFPFFKYKFDTSVIRLFCSFSSSTRVGHSAIFSSFPFSRGHDFIAARRMSFLLVSFLLAVSRVFLPLLLGHCYRHTIVS